MRHLKSFINMIYSEYLMIESRCVPSEVVLTNKRRRLTTRQQKSNYGVIETERETGLVSHVKRFVGRD